MFLRSCRMACATASAFVALLAVPSLVMAQQNSTSFPWNSGGGGRGGGFSSPGTFFPPQAPAFYPPAANPTMNAQTSRAFYPDFATPDKVRFNVTVPAGAKVTFDGVGTTQTGNFRRFVSPAMSAGRYTYNIQAVWTEDGREVRQSRSVRFEPGDVVQVTFTRDGAAMRTEP